jgi:transmembrane sensor
MEERTNRNNKPLSSKEKEEIKNNIYKHLQLPATSGSIRFFPGGRNGWIPRTVAAAVLFIAIGTSVYLWFRPAAIGIRTDTNGYAGLLEIRTGSGEMKRITLSDKTVVLLNANSIFRYSNDFQEGSSREVELEGNAFFTVQKDRLHAPFVVHTRSLNVTVLGTELNINARSAEPEVELASGKVKVEQKGGAGNTIYLQPGEKVKLDTAQNNFLKSEIHPQLYEAWTKGKWNFRQNTLEEITGLIREFYGVDILFKKQKSKKLRIDAVLPVTSLQNIVSVIEQTLQINIQVNNNQLIVQ